MVTLRQQLIFFQDNYDRYMLEMVERASLDRFFLVYDKKLNH